MSNNIRLVHKNSYHIYLYKPRSSRTIYFSLYILKKKKKSFVLYDHNKTAILTKQDNSNHFCKLKKKKKEKSTVYKLSKFVPKESTQLRRTANCLTSDTYDPQLIFTEFQAHLNVC